MPESDLLHCGYVIKVTDLRPHPNADRLQLLHVFETDTCVSLDTHVGDIGVYFPSDLQLSEKYCQVNDLIARKDENGNRAGGFLEPNRHVRAIRLRGERSDGVYMPLTSLSEFCDITTLRPGDTISVINGEEICRKYIPPVTKSKTPGVVLKSAKKNIAPLFFEHVDTAQVAYNLDKFHRGDTIQLTLKMHGTSQRTGYLPLVKEKKRNLLQKIFHRPACTYKEYGYITGTRRVVLEPSKPYDGFYDSRDWRDAMAAKFEGKLFRGETVYYEVVGFQGTNGDPIMASVSNSKIKDKEFTHQYGDTTVFSYGCNPSADYYATEPCCELYVYRMTMVNEDGYVVEYSPAQIRKRCEQMGVKYVMEFETFVIPPHVDPGEFVAQKIELYYDGADPIGRTHVREGVVARILNHSNFDVYKMKNYSFRVLEGIIKDDASAPDMEEAQEVVEN